MFFQCGSLKSINIPSTVVEIGELAFSDCEGLNSVNISDLDSWREIDFKNKEANPLSYAKKLYLNNKLVTEVTFPENTEVVKDFVFCNAVDINKITLGGNIKSIGENAFTNTAFFNDSSNWKDNVLYLNRTKVDIKPFHKVGFEKRQYNLPTREHKILLQSGLYRLYLYYCYKLGTLPKYQKPKPSQIHYLIRDDLTRLNTLTAQVTLLARHNISTDEQLFSYKHSVEENLSKLIADREHLRKQVRLKTDDVTLSKATRTRR